MHSAKKIILCADDFAQNSAISRGILNLVERQRLSAVSCFTDSSLWQQYGAELSGHHNEIDLGLHFNLTHDFGYLNRPLGYWLARSVVAQLPLKEIRENLHRQCSEFMRVTGRVPDFIDGHQHVHILPGVRRVLLDYLAGQNLIQALYVRSVVPMIPCGDDLVKAFVIRMLATGWRTAITGCCPTNTTFAGVYSLKGEENYPALFQGWLARSETGGLIMCHPGLESDDMIDVIRGARVVEYQFFQSDRFPEMCKALDVTIARFSKQTGPSKAAGCA